MPSNIIYKEDVAHEIAQIWNCADDTVTNAIADNMSVRRFKKNAIIYHESQQPTKLLFLVEGKVKIVKECGLGRAQIVRAIKEKQFLGYRAFLARECYTTSAMAFEDSVIAAVPLDIVSGMISSHYAIARYFLYELATILGMTDGRIVSLTQKHIRGRLAETILALRNNYGVEPDGQTLNIAMNRDDLASLSNMSTSNAIRTLSAFAQEGILSIDGRRIRILDLEMLKKISEMG